MQKNVTGQKLVVFAFNRTTNVAQTGDAANITANLRKDHGAAVATNDVNPTETEDGFYVFDLTQAETNADTLQAFPASITADIQVIAVPGVIYTTPVSFADDIIQTADHTSALSTIDSNVDAILLDTNELQTNQGNWLTATGFSTFNPATDTVANVTTVATTTNLTNLPSIPANWLTSAGIAASALNGKGDWNIGKTGYALTQTFPANFADMSIAATTGLVDITQVAADKAWSTSTRVLTANTNLNDISVSDVLTTQMAESYAADGVAPTLSQALFLIQQSVSDFSYSGVTQTVKKLDGSTTAATFTLDSSTDPITSKTRSS